MRRGFRERDEKPGKVQEEGDSIGETDEDGGRNERRGEQLKDGEEADGDGQILNNRVAHEKNLRVPVNLDVYILAQLPEKIRVSVAVWERLPLVEQFFPRRWPHLLRIFVSSQPAHLGLESFHTLNCGTVVF